MGSDNGGRGLEVGIDTVAPHPLNLREDQLWDSPNDRAEMIASINSVGLIQDLVVGTRAAFVTEHPDLEGEIGTARYVVLAGHRRLDACRGAEKTKVRISVRDDLVQKFALTVLIENLKRLELNPFQEAEGYRRLERDGMSHSQIADAVGRSKSTVTKRLRLLDLPPEAKRAVLARDLSSDVAYNLAVALGDQVNRILDAAALMRTRKLSVQDAVNHILHEAAPGPGSDRTDTGPEAPVNREAEPSAKPSEELGQAAAVRSEPAVPPTRVEPTVPSARAEPPGSSADDRPDPKEPSRPRNKDAGRAIADSARNTHCQKLVTEYNAANPDEPIVRVATTALIHASTAAMRRAHSWMKDANASNAAAISADGYRDAVLVAADPATIVRLAYAVALAEAEILACNRARSWDYRDLAHLEHLKSTGYSLTEWDLRQLGKHPQEATHG